MKLAEALVLRADLGKRMSQLKGRAMNSAVYQEGAAPAEDVAELRADYERMAAQLVTLVERINRTNLAVMLPSGETLTAALATRDGLQWRRSFLLEVSAAANATRTRMTRTELLMVSAVPISEYQKEADDLARRFRELDTAIQSMNWTADLLD
jgi:hypothetical protein